MSRAPLQQRLISIVEPAVNAAGYELVELRFLLEQGGWTLRVAVDLPLEQHGDRDEVPSDRVDLTACEELSRELSAVLDVEDPIPQAFSLEVSSPGIDRPLRTAAHFAYFAGSEAKIQLAVPLQLPSGERRNFKGILQGVEGSEVLIECDGAAFRLPIDDIEHAKLVPDWDAVMKGKSGTGRVADRATPVKPGHRASPKGRVEQAHDHRKDGSSSRRAQAHSIDEIAADAENKEQG
ncbi:MAG TPA: ribosome maturation factor RimP [Kofleriaceae bacterium]|nr:ribosome maturation factor RimP [Kofleriaceae bacterium]